jgi:nitrogen regulatory protein P-II 1
MQLLVLILNREEKLEEILTYCLGEGVTGATLLESEGMGRILSKEVPIFAGFRDLFAPSKPLNRTILSVVPDDLAQRLGEGVDRILGGWGEPGAGLLFTLPVGRVWGVEKG